MISRNFPLYLVEGSIYQGGWSYENFIPTVASQIPFRVKEQMLLDAKRTALSESDVSNRAALQVSLAFFNRFGTERDFPIAMQYIRMASSSTCLPAQMLLLILQYRYQGLDKLETITPACDPRGSIFTELGVWASPKYLRDSPSQFLSPYGLNKLENHSPQISPSLWSDRTVSTCSNQPARYQQDDIDSSLILACQLGDLEGLISLASRKKDLFSCESSGLTPLHYLFMFDKDDETLQHALKILLPMHIDSGGPLLEAYCSEPQTLDQQLPFSLTGTPLGFAVLAGSLASVEALLRVGADPLSCGPEREASPLVRSESPLQNAISYHRADIFSSLWESCLNRPEWHDELVSKALVPENCLFSQLCVRSFLELWVMESDNDDIRRSQMVLALAGAIWKLVGSNTESQKLRNC
ncbi:uncharacterized protein BKA55DRAFT_218640 [Fusarium redolens]|uniref:Ankyrin n=1 Tax=Fusarium redolens TaxID=48865 RepID=A0A9P9JL21_FUSRE|nr:uncharacterized protein BKA55DRAFT_218640 [Fusarium redolens]KAH7216971.1 hypothetical protein BKA55DRAFT_218640 [Fusarium redolens]